MTRIIKNEIKPSLFPIYKKNQSERRLLSMLLRSAQLMPEICQKLLAIPDINRAKRDIKKAAFYLEPTFDPPFKNLQHSVPVALIKIGNTSLFIEAKVGNSDLDKSQLEDYMKIAGDVGVQHILTISNQMTSYHDDHPTGLKLTKKLKLSHVSWTHLRIEIEQLLKSENPLSDMEISIITDLLYYMDNSDSSGVWGFTSMGKGWATLCDSAKDIRVDNAIYDEVINDWLQEEKEIALILTHILADHTPPVSMYLPPKQRKNRTERHKALVASLKQKGLIETSYNIPRAADGLEVKIDTYVKTISIQMNILLEKQWTLRGQMNVLKRMLNHESFIFSDCLVKIRELRAHTFEHIPFPKLFNDKWHYDEIIMKRAAHVSCVYEVHITKAQFRSGRQFIKILERSVKEFHRDIGRHLINQRRPPSDVIDD